jgi:Rrf2 family protein
MFTKSTEYALRAVVYLAKNSSEEKRFGIKTIAQSLGFPEPYLAKVLQHLVRRKIIQSSKGPNGGFQASKQTMEISLLEIIDANEGLDFFNRCGLGLVECEDSKPCPIHNEYGKFREGLYNTLSEKKIKDIIEDIESGLIFMNLDSK